MALHCTDAAACNGNGACVDGVCECTYYYTGAQCELPFANACGDGWTAFVAITAAVHVRTPPPAHHWLTGSHGARRRARRCACVLLAVAVCGGFMCVSVCPPSDRRRGAVPLIECARAPNGDSCALPRAHAARVGSSLPLAACHSDSVTLCWRYSFFYWVCWAGCALSGVGISCGHDAATVTCAATCVRVLTRDVCLYGETGVRRARRWTLALAARKARPGRAARVTCLCRCCAAEAVVVCDGGGVSVVACAGASRVQCGAGGVRRACA